MHVYTSSAQAGTRLWILQLTVHVYPSSVVQRVLQHRKCFIYFICIYYMHSTYMFLFCLCQQICSPTVYVPARYTFCCSFHDLENDPYVSALQIYPVCTSFYGISQVVSMPWCQSWRGTLKRQVGIYEHVLQIHSCLILLTVLQSYILEIKF